MAVDVGSAVGYLDLDINGFLNGLKQAQLQANNTTQSIASKMASNMESAGKKISSVGSTLTKGLTVPIVTVGALSVKTAATFEQSMSKVSALSGATGKDLDSLSKKAQEMGAKTKFSASEASDAMGYMALAGWDTKDMLDGIDGVLSLAAAGELDLAQASDMVTDYLTAFGLSAKDASHMSDVLAKTSVTTNTSVSQLGDAFSNCAANAHASGVDLETTSALLGTLANSGLKGAEAGTALSAVFRDMTDKMKDGAIQIGDTSVKVMDANGNYRNMIDIIKDCQDATNGMGDAQAAAAMSTTFTSHSIKAMRLLMAAGADSVDGLTDSLYNCDGAASKISDELLNNLNGQLTIIKSSLEGVAIKLGQALMPYVKQFAQFLQNLLDKMNAMSDEEIQQVIKIAAVVAAIGPVLIVIGKLITSIGLIIDTGRKLASGFKLVTTSITHVKEAFLLAKGGMTAFAGETSKIGAALAGISAPVIAVVAVIAVLVAAFVHLWKTNEDFRNNIIGIWNGIKAKFESFCKGIVDRLNALGFSFEDITEVISAAWDALCSVLAPVIEGIFQNISNIISTTLDIITGVLDVFIGLFTGNWDQLWLGVQEIFGGVWDGICSFFSNIGNTILGVLDSVCALFGTTWDSTWENIKSFFEEIWNGISEFFTGIWEGISSTFDTAINTISTTWDTVWGTVSSVVTTVWETITNVIQFGILFIQEIISAAFTLITAPFRFIWENCKETIISVWDAISSKVSTVLEIIKSIITTVFNAIKSVVTNVMNAINSVISTIWNAIKSVFTTVVNALKPIVSTAFNAIKSTITNVFNAVKTVTSTVWNAIKSTISNVLNAIKSVVSSVLNSVKSVFSSVWNGVKSVVSSVINGIKSTISSGLNSAKSTVSSVLSSISSKFSSIFDTCKETVKGAIDKIKGFFNFSWSLPKLKMPHPKIEGSFSLNPPSVPHFSLDWYNKAMNGGMILNGAQIFGMMGNKLLAGGESGSETVVGTGSLLSMIRASVKEGMSGIIGVVSSFMVKTTDVLQDLSDSIGMLTKLKNGLFSDDTGYIGYGGLGDIKGRRNSGEAGDVNDNRVVNNYTFNSQAKLSEVECRHEMIQAQKELALDF